MRGAITIQSVYAQVSGGMLKASLARRNAEQAMPKWTHNAWGASNDWSVGGFLWNEEINFIWRGLVRDALTNGDYEVVWSQTLYEAMITLKNKCTCEEVPPDWEHITADQISGTYPHLPATVLKENETCPNHGSRRPLQPPQEMADTMALIAQKYAGYFVGHPFRSAQYGNPNTSTVDKRRKWREPAVVPDDCEFCQHMTDEDVERRISGYQGQIDKEVLRSKYLHFGEWIDLDEDVPDPEGGTNSDVNRRAFCELRQDMPTDKRPNGWEEKPFPLVHLPMRLKRKLCIEWNHAYLPWMEEEGLEYDFEQRIFRKTEARVQEDAADEESG